MNRTRLYELWRSGKIFRARIQQSQSSTSVALTQTKNVEEAEGTFRSQKVRLDHFGRAPELGKGSISADRTSSAKQVAQAEEAENERAA